MADGVQDRPGIGPVNGPRSRAGSLEPVPGHDSTASHQLRYSLAIDGEPAHHAPMQTPCEHPGSFRRTRLATVGAIAALLFAFAPATRGEAGTVRQEQAPGETVAPHEKRVDVQEERSLVTLAALEESRQAKQAELKASRAAFDPEIDGELRLSRLEEIRELETEIQRLTYDFESIATGIDVHAFDLGVEEEFDLIQELTAFLEPLLAELREATESPREYERLRKLLEFVTEQESLARSALENVTSLVETAQDVELRAALEQSRAIWQARVSDLENQHTVAEFQLENHLENRESVLESTRGALAKFFRTRGLNLFLALAAFLGILLGLRAIYKLIKSLLPRRTRPGRPFYTRLIDVVYFTLSGILAVSGALLVLYAAGDWPLLGLAILALLGLAWASKTALPMFFEQINLLLNFGTVREAERVIVNGLPFRVVKISLRAELTNPALTGGTIRLPLQDLPGLRSRPCVQGETWFPTEGGDWVLLPGGDHGRVERQTLEVVRVRLRGGAILSFPTTDFFALGARNLSQGFRIEQRFGVDYGLQAISTTEVPAKMQAGLERELPQLVKEGQLRSVKVEFLEAGSSSLDYAILCECGGAAAEQYNIVSRAIQRILVDICTEEGWSIPFTQVTLHQAPD
jgi:small-conductance mechanosensitive channel